MSSCGALRSGADNFEVTEQPAYEPCGEGEHLWLWIEKRGLTTTQAISLLAKAAKLPKKALGFAGRKDRHAITRQWISVHQPGEQEPRIPSEWEHCHEDTYIRVIKSDRHRNKIKLGHTSGNHFRLGLDVTQPTELAKHLADLTTNGIPNRFGEQRFGKHGANIALAQTWGAGNHQAAVAWAIDPSGAWTWGAPLPEGFRPGDDGRILGALRKGAEPSVALKAAGHRYCQFIASAAQAAIFNAVLDYRQHHQFLHQVRVGDCLMTSRGGCFAVTDLDLTEAQNRVDQRDVVITGPLPGTRSLPIGPTGDADERSWSATTGIDWDWFQRGQIFESPGERRPLLIYFTQTPQITTDEQTTWLSFGLPAGSYATEVLAAAQLQVPEQRHAT